MFNKYRYNRGFTLMEILITIAIFSFAIIPIILLYTFSSKANIKSNNMLTATLLAQEALEQFKHIEYDRLYAILRKNALGTEPDEIVFQPVEYLLDYGEIANSPDFKRIVKLEFYPDSSPNIEAPANEFDRMISRVKISVEIRFIERVASGSEVIEHQLNMMTIVSRKE